jgi:hypothetical protein
MNTYNSLLSDVRIIDHDIISNANLIASQKKVLSAILEFTDSTYKADIQIPILLKITNLTRQGIYQALHSLEKKEFLTIIKSGKAIDCIQINIKKLEELIITHSKIQKIKQNYDKK